MFQNGFFSAFLLSLSFHTVAPQIIINPNLHKNTCLFSINSNKLFTRILWDFA